MRRFGIALCLMLWVCPAFGQAIEPELQAEMDAVLKEHAPERILDIQAGETYREAYLRLAKKFHPDRLSGIAADRETSEWKSFNQKAEATFRHVTDAYNRFVEGYTPSTSATSSHAGTANSKSKTSDQPAASNRPQRSRWEDLRVLRRETLQADYLIRNGGSGLIFEILAEFSVYDPKTGEVLVEPPPRELMLAVREYAAKTERVNSDRANVEKVLGQVVDQIIAPYAAKTAAQVPQRIAAAATLLQWLREVPSSGSHQLVRRLEQATAKMGASEPSFRRLNEYTRLILSEHFQELSGAARFRFTICDALRIKKWFRR